MLKLNTRLKSNANRTFSYCVAIIFALSSVQLSFSQISIPNTTTVTENFNSMNATTTTPANWRVKQGGAPTWAGGGTALGFQASSGTPATGGFYNWGTTPATDRALGVMTSGSYASPNSVMGFYRNTNASNLTQLAVTYDLERYRINTAAASVQFFYSTDGTTWTAVAAGDIAAATIGTGASAYGYAPQATFSVASFNITGLNIATNNDIYLRWNLNTTGSNSQGIGIDNVGVTATFSSPCAPATEPTVLTSSVTISEGCNSAQINFNGGNGTNRIILMSATCPIASTPSDQVNYASSSAFGSGSTIGAGNYVVFNGSAGTTFVTNLTPGTSYCIRIYEYNGTSANCDENYLITGVTETTFTTVASCSSPQIRSILVNACTVTEGYDEVVVMSNGNSALNINNIQLDFPSGGSYCNSGCGAQTLTNNAAYINSLNTLAGCSLFQYATTIPAGATIVVFTGLNPTMVFNYSAECPGGGPYYVIFANNASDNSGRFANNAGANRTLTVSFGGGVSDAVTFLSSNGTTGNDGDFASFDDAGTCSYGNTANCATPLPLEWGYFDISSKINSALINWSTLTERNTDYFALEVSTAEESLIFEEIGRVGAQGSASSETHYSFTTDVLKQGYYYFRIKQVDMNGLFSYSDVKTVTIAGKELALLKVTSDNLQTRLKFNHKLDQGSVITIFEITGKKIYEQRVKNPSDSIEIEELLKGMLLISIEHPGKDIQTFKLVLE